MICRHITKNRIGDSRLWHCLDCDKFIYHDPEKMAVLESDNDDEQKNQGLIGWVLTILFVLLLDVFIEIGAL